ncbi:MAG: hypothetical protein ABL949_05665 [Fimbriimonadaceae bacterium]
MGISGTANTIRPELTRRLRVLAFDPSLSVQLETAALNQLTVGVPWEDGLRPGPIGEYIEVIDRDPASDKWYEPVDLNDPIVLAQDGLAPSESDPRFHQQMVYAVAMTTIRNFERALGRVAFWSDHRKRNAAGDLQTQFVRRLRIYPHAIRDRNAYYSPLKKALLFGYFPAGAKNTSTPPGTVVFTCLSHDIVAHEVTHALLDGVHPRFNFPSNGDVLAFHEAFSDIVALFQHFSHPNVILSQISRCRGNLGAENLLSQLAQQFGQATGRGLSLRDALGRVNPKTGEWEPMKPDPRALLKIKEPHGRGAILVAAVFRAFLKIYRWRTADLFRIASGGTGNLPDGDIHPDLAKRLANEAAATADRVLQMCIRAIDYCPPVDITFGDYLRAIVTADLDFAPNEGDSYRLVFVESFREWGIHPRNVVTLGIDSLAWPSMREIWQDAVALGSSQMLHGQEELQQRLKDEFLAPAMGKLNWTLDSDRFSAWTSLSEVSKILWHWLYNGDSIGKDYARLVGLRIDGIDPHLPNTVYRKNGRPTVEIHSVRPAIRRAASGGYRTDLVVEITQRRRGYFDAGKQREIEAAGGELQIEEKGDFTYRSGCTIVIDPSSGDVRWVIKTAGDIADNQQLDRIRNFMTGGEGVYGNAFDAGLPPTTTGAQREEPFALLHQLGDEPYA